MAIEETDWAFGKKLREVREAKGIGVRELARMAGLHPTYISKLERLQVLAPEWDKIVALATALESDELLQYGRDALLARLMDNLEFVIHSSRGSLEAKLSAITETKDEMIKIANHLIDTLSVSIARARKVSPKGKEE